MLMRSWICALGAAVATGTGGGCSDGRVLLVTAEALDRVDAGLAVAMEEYQADLFDADGQRSEAVLEAYLAQLRDAADGERAALRGRFREATQRLEHDRAVAVLRYQAVQEHLAALREIARSLRHRAAAVQVVDERGLAADGAGTDVPPATARNRTAAAPAER